MFPFAASSFLPETSPEAPGKPKSPAIEANITQPFGTLFPQALLLHGSR